MPYKKERSLPLFLERVKKELQKKSFQESESGLSPGEQTLLSSVKERTNQWNQNNVTRTKAYLSFFNRHPEIHWAFLGHMVSRNGGWNMTDLKGGFLSELLTNEEAVSFFTFLERGNWLIFQDAFPQFLIYEESLKQEKPLFYLLPYLHVSVFMKVIWEQFWKERDSSVLAIAQIINEQSYLEARVVQNQNFKKKVLHTIEFHIQEILSLNQILFPYEDGFKKTKLIGQTLRLFESLHERILLGKRLYRILFGNRKQLERAKKWANANPHTGSRKDYWPHLFSDINEGVPGTILIPRLKSCRLHPRSIKIYSPRLEYVWKDVEHADAKTGDWYKSWHVLHYLMDSGIETNGEIEGEYCKTLEKLSFAAAGKKTISLIR